MFFFISAITLKICQKHRDSISHIERTVNVLGEDPTKIKTANASIDKTNNFEACLYLQI